MTDARCYLERSKVRSILISQPDESLYITEEILREVDSLPIIAAEDMRVPAQEIISCGVQLQARPADGGDWIDIYPAQLAAMAKIGHDVRAIEWPVPSSWQPADALRKATIEECAQVADAQVKDFLSPEYASNQPFGSLCERFACETVAKAIRDLAHPSTDREYDPNVAPCDDAEFGMKP